jgi:hypothetical protein
MRRVAFVGAVVVVLATSVAGQEAVEVKFDKPRVGERLRVTVSEMRTTKRVVTGKGKDQNTTDTVEKELVYGDEILAVMEGAYKPTKLKRTFEKAVVTVNGKKIALPLEDNTVLIEKKGERYVFTIDGKAVEGDSAQLLEGEFNRPGKENPRDLFLPNKPVKPGETWALDADKIARSMRDQNLKVDKAKIEATGKLVRAYKVGSAQFGVLEITFSAPITDLVGPAKEKIKEGSMSVSVTGDGCIDGTSPQGKSTVTTKLRLSATGDDFDLLKVEASSTESRTTTPVKK